MTMAMVPYDGYPYVGIRVRPSLVKKKRLFTRLDQLSFWFCKVETGLFFSPPDHM